MHRGFISCLLLLTSVGCCGIYSTREDPSAEAQTFVGHHLVALRPLQAYPICWSTYPLVSEYYPNVERERNATILTEGTRLQIVQMLRVSRQEGIYTQTNASVEVARVESGEHQGMLVDLELLPWRITAATQPDVNVRNGILAPLRDEGP